MGSWKSVVAERALTTVTLHPSTFNNMKLYVCLVLAFAFFSGLNAALSYQEVTGKNGVCLYQGNIYAVGEEWDEEDFCATNTCYKEDGKYFVQQATCPYQTADGTWVGK